MLSVPLLSLIDPSLAPAPQLLMGLEAVVTDIAGMLLPVRT